MKAALNRDMCLALQAACRGLYGEAYRGRRVLLTGDTGFKGSWLALWLRGLGARVEGLALESDTSPSHHRLLVGDAPASAFDLRDAAAVRLRVQAVQPEIVFHLAAQPLVRRGYREPESTFATNVGGLIHLLEAVRESASVRAVVNVTTDKCYQNREVPRSYREDDALGGRDPYSASKACAEIVSACWRDSFLATRDSGPVLLATARAGNVIGGGDWSEDRLIPDLVRSATRGVPVPIRNPEAVRPWQHVLEPLAGYLLLGQRLLQGDRSAARAWNFGPPAEGHIDVATVVERFAKHWPAIGWQGSSGVHPHEAKLLHLDCSDARARLGWQALWNTDTTIQRTADWYRRHAESGAVNSRADLLAYIDAARAQRQCWTGARSAVPIELSETHILADEAA